MGSSCETCCTSSTFENGENGSLKKKRNVEHVRVGSIERVPTVSEMNNLLNKGDVSHINIDPRHCRVPTMGDVDNLILANPFAPDLNDSMYDKDDIEIGITVYLEITKISKYGIQGTLPSYDNVKGFIDKENISEELNKKLNHYGKEGDVKYMIKSHLKNLQSLQTKVLTYDPIKSIVTCSCLLLNDNDDNDA